MRQNLGHHPLHEPVVNLDPTAAERFLEDLVDERGHGLIAGFVAGEGDDWRLQLLIVQQSKERHLRRLVDSRHAGAACGVAEVLDIAHPDAREHVGRSGAIHDHLGAAVIDEVMRRHDRQARRLEAYLQIPRHRLRQRSQREKRLAAGRDHQAGRAGLQFRNALLAERAGDTQVVGVGLCGRGFLAGLCRVSFGTGPRADCNTTPCSRTHSSGACTDPQLTGWSPRLGDDAPGVLGREELGRR